MSNYFSLLKVQMLSVLGINKFLHGKKSRLVGKVAGILAMGLLVICSLVFAGRFYSKMLLSYEEVATHPELFMPLMLGYAMFVSLIFSFVLSGNVLYNSKDFEMLSALPIKPVAIVCAKLTAMNVANVFFCTILVIPAVAMAVTNLNASVLEVVRFIIMTMFVSILPMCIANLLAGIATMISSKFKRSGLVYTIFLSLIFLLFIGLSYFINISDSAMAFLNIIPVLPLVIKGIENWWYVLLSTGISLGFCAVTGFLLTAFYYKINNLIRSKKSSKNYVLRKSYKQTNIRKVLYKRNMKLMFSFPMCSVSIVLGMVVCVLSSVIFSVVLFVSFSSLPVETFLPFGLLIFLMTAMVMIPFYACISFEGKTFYLIKTLPVRAKDYIKSKMAVYVTLSTTCITVCSVFMTAFLGVEILTSVAFVLTSVLISLQSGMAHILCNLKFPMMKWDSPDKPLKQSVSALIMTVMFFLLSGAVFLITNFVSTPLIGIVIFGGIILMMALLELFILITRGEKMLMDIE